MVSLITGPCDTTNADYKPDIDCMPIWLTNYIPYNVDEWGMPILDKDSGELTFPTESNLQCLIPCNITGTGQEINTDSIWNYSACITDWIGWHIEVGGIDLWCVDTYGNPEFRKPFYHEDLQSWVIGVDVITHEPLGILVHDWDK